jgi:hypothetical protein
MYAAPDAALLARCSGLRSKDAARRANALGNAFAALLATTIDAAGLTLAALFRLSDTGGAKSGGDGLLDYGEVTRAHGCGGRGYWAIVLYKYYPVFLQRTGY